MRVGLRALGQRPAGALRGGLFPVQNEVEEVGKPEGMIAHPILDALAHGDRVVAKDFPLQIESLWLAGCFTGGRRWTFRGLTHVEREEILRILFANYQN